MVRAGLALNDELMLMLMLVIDSEIRHSLPAVAGRVRPNGGQGAKPEMGTSEDGEYRLK
jgi:hypothetical protein